ncbi:MAG: electron transfer flavoprotein subunit beta [Planctomycetes bacterium]|nr:electron transfer flavoprotein subunit beta [Planctomycetota bacterium]MCB9871355.1 electron transfer flavoprotein subunit beta [Planctomycetota bacterium]MCB9888609.1 electron transfer flavoprotein subunit beta [Planctomycetota bacterium]
MNIAVPIKLVPDLVEELELNDDGSDLDHDALTYKINEFCDHALEEALQLKEAHGGSVTVLALDRDEADKALFTALAKGADRAIKVTGIDENTGTLTAAHAFRAALAGVEFDVLLTGVQAPDDREGQLGVLLASLLEIPHVSAVSEVSFDGGTVTLHKEFAGGVLARYQVAPKVVLGIQSARQAPRYAPVSRVRQLMKEASLDEIEVESPTNTSPEVRRVFRPTAGRGAEMLAGTTEDVAARIAELVLAHRGAR